MNNSLTYSLCYLVGAIIILTFTIIFFYPVNGKEAKKTLDYMGFTDVKITGYHFFACAGEDWYHTAFEAKNASGKKVSGTVCSGLIFKNSTVRFD